MFDLTAEAIRVTSFDTIENKISVISLTIGTVLLFCCCWCLSFHNDFVFVFVFFACIVLGKKYFYQYIAMLSSLMY